MSWYPGKLIDRLRSGTRTQLRPERLSEIAKSMSQEELREYLAKKFLHVLSDIDLAIQSWLSINHALADALLALEEITRMHKEAGIGYKDELIRYTGELLAFYDRISTPEFEYYIRGLVSLGYPTPVEQSMAVEEKIGRIRAKLDQAFRDIEDIRRELVRVREMIIYRY
jgi:hypothetical protein